MNFDKKPVEWDRLYCVSWWLDTFIGHLHAEGWQGSGPVSVSALDGLMADDTNLSSLYYIMI